jgi:hypothetical protein
MYASDVGECRLLADGVAKLPKCRATNFAPSRIPLPCRSFVATAGCFSAKTRLPVSRAVFPVSFADRLFQFSQCAFQDCARSSRRHPFQTLQSFGEFSRLEGLHVGLDNIGDFAGICWGEVAGGDRSQHSRDSCGGVLGTFDRRQLDGDWPIFARRQNAIQQRRSAAMSPVKARSIAFCVRAVA